MVQLGLSDRATSRPAGGLTKARFATLSRNPDGSLRLTKRPAPVRSDPRRNGRRPPSPRQQDTPSEPRPAGVQPRSGILLDLGYTGAAGASVNAPVAAASLAIAQMADG
jgi:hypothetical protein